MEPPPCPAGPVTAPPLPPLDSDRLAVFVAVADQGGFSAAARALARSQPAVHSQVRLLGEALGVQLYRREGRGIVLTAAGAAVAAHGRELQQRDAALRAALAGTASPTVALATGAGALRYLLGPALRAAIGAGLRPRPLLGDAAATVAAVREGRAPLGLTVAAPTSDLCDRPVHTGGLALLLPATHPLAGPGPLALAALAGQPLILPPADRPLRAAIEGALAAAGVGVDRPVAVGGWALAAHLGSLGLGLPVVAALVPPPDGMIARPLPELPRATHRLFWRPGSLHGPAAALAAPITARVPGAR